MFRAEIFIMLSYIFIELFESLWSPGTRNKALEHLEIGALDLEMEFKLEM